MNPKDSDIVDVINMERLTRSERVMVYDILRAKYKEKSVIEKIDDFITHIFNKNL